MPLSFMQPFLTRRKDAKCGKIVATTATNSFSVSSFHALIRSPEQPIRVISLAGEPPPIKHAQSAKKPPK